MSGVSVKTQCTAREAARQTIKRQIDDFIGAGGLIHKVDANICDSRGHSPVRASESSGVRRYE